MQNHWKKTRVNGILTDRTEAYLLFEQIMNIRQTRSNGGKTKREKEKTTNSATLNIKYSQDDVRA